MSWVKTRSSVYLISLLFGLLLQFIVLPDALTLARPMWIPLLLVGWTLNAPQLPNLLMALLLGLCMDVMLNCPLGQHALGLLVLVYIVARLRKTLVVYPHWQITVALVPLWAGYALLMAVIDERAHHLATPSLRWWPLLPTTLLWPVIDVWLTLLDHRHPADTE